jgi:hypothetical protein
MFKVKEKATGQIYTVYVVRNEDVSTWFLIYDDVCGWEWRLIGEFIPVEE